MSIQEIIDNINYAEIKPDTNRIRKVTGYINVAIMDRKYHIRYIIREDGTIEYFLPGLDTSMNVHNTTLDPYKKLVKCVAEDLSYSIIHNETRSLSNYIYSISKFKYTDKIANIAVSNRKKAIKKQLEKFIWKDLLSRPRRLPSLIEILQKKRFQFMIGKIEGARPITDSLDMAQALYQYPLDVARLVAEKAVQTMTNSVITYLQYILVPQTMDKSIIKAINKTKGKNRKKIFRDIQYGGDHYNTYRELIKHNSRNMHAYIISSKNSYNGIYHEEATPTMIDAAVREVKRDMSLPNAIHPLEVFKKLFSHVQDSRYFVPRAEKIKEDVKVLHDKLQRARSPKKLYEYSKRIHEFMMDDARLANKEIYEADTFPAPESLKEIEDLRLKKGGDLINYGSEYRHCLGSYANSAIKSADYFYRLGDAVGQIKFSNYSGTMEFVQCHGPNNRENANSKKLTKILMQIIKNVDLNEILEICYSKGIEIVSSYNPGSKSFFKLTGTDDLPF